MHGTCRQGIQQASVEVLACPLRPGWWGLGWNGKGFQRNCNDQIHFKVTSGWITLILLKISISTATFEWGFKAWLNPSAWRFIVSETKSTFNLKETL